MHHYNPDQKPAATEWLALDEQKRINLVEQYHRKARIKISGAKLHAVIHVVVENQIAQGHEPVVRAMSRLRSEGLSRHDALHAIGSVFTEHLFELLRGGPAAQDSMSRYDGVVDRLTAAAWLRG